MSNQNYRNPALKSGIPLCFVNIRSSGQAVTYEDLQDEIPRKLMLWQQQLINAELRYVPCWHVVLDYHVAGLNRRNYHEGTMEFIVDERKGSSLIDDDVEFGFCYEQVNSRLITEGRFTMEIAEKKAITDARWKVGLSRFKSPPELSTVSIKKFYRPYFRAMVARSGRPSEVWIPADGYGNYFVYK